MFQGFIARQTGMQLSEYITQVRMEEARRLLKTTTESDRGIACKVGYLNVACCQVSCLPYKKWRNPTGISCKK